MLTGQNNSINKETVTSLGQEITYIPEDCKVVYQSKDGKEEKIFDALE